MSKKNLYAFIFSSFILLIVIAFNYYSFERMKKYTFAVEHSRQVITTFENIANNFKSAQIYTPALDTGELKNLYDLYKANANSIPGQLEHLKYLLKNDPPQEKLADSLANLINEQLPALLLMNTSDLIHSRETWRLPVLLKVHQKIQEGIQREENLLAERNKNLKEFSYLNNLLTIVLSLLATAIIVFTFLSNLLISKQRNWLEGFLESIFNSSQNGIIYYKAIKNHGAIADFKIEYANRTIEALLGISPHTVRGKKLSEISSSVKALGPTEKYIDVVESGKSDEFETFYKKDNIERWLLVSFVKLDEGLTATFHDISQLKKYETELKEKIKDLEHSNTELEQYAYVASHDLQEPLRKIRAFGSYLQDTQANKLDEKGQDQLNKIIASAERMSILIKDILSFSSLKKQTTFTVVDLNDVLNFVLQDLDFLITQKDATIHSCRLPAIEAIPLQMTQLFYNLINNSLKFAKDNVTPVINISCCLVNHSKPSLALQSSNYYEIIFSDNGIGFSDEYKEKIFGLFKRLNDRYSYPGSGIGLSICKKVVENHHGKIVAEGKENEGAVFHVFLPEKQN